MSVNVIIIFIKILNSYNRMEFDDVLITTGVDALVRLVKNREKIELEDAASQLGMAPETLEEWARVLEEEGIMRIEYKLTKVFLVWIAPTTEEIEMEKESFLEERSSIQNDISKFREKITKDTKDVRNLQTLFLDFYARVYPRIEILEGQVAALPTANMVSDSIFTKSEEKLGDVEGELETVRKSLEEIKDQMSSIIISDESAGSEQLFDEINDLRSELGDLEKEMQSIHRNVSKETSEDVKLPSKSEFRKKFESLKKEFVSLRAKNNSMHEDMIGLHESSDMLKNLTTSITGQEDSIGKLRNDIKALSKEADELVAKANKVASNVNKSTKSMERYENSINVAKGILTRFPSQKNLKSQFVELEKREKSIEEKMNAMDELLKALGGRQINAKQFSTLDKKIAERMRKMRMEIDALDQALSNEKNTFLSFQKIKERIVPSLQGYDKKLTQMEQEIEGIRLKAANEKKTLREDAKKLKSTLKDEGISDVMKIAEEIREKRQSLDQIKNIVDDLAETADKLNKRMTLLSHQAKLLEIRSSGKGIESESPTEKQVTNEFELTEDEEREFRKKREELRRLIKKLWE